MAARKPAHEIRLGRIRVAIWANGSDDQDVWFNVTVNRRYHDDDGWKDTSSFRRDDLPIVAKAMDMAYAWIWSHQTTRAQAVSEQSEA